MIHSFSLLNLHCNWLYHFFANNYMYLQEVFEGHDRYKKKRKIAVKVKEIIVVQKFLLNFNIIWKKTWSSVPDYDIYKNINNVLIIVSCTNVFDIFCTIFHIEFQMHVSNYVNSFVIYCILGCLVNIVSFQ